METSYLWTLMTASNLYYILEENKKYSSNLQHKQCIYSNLWSGVGEMFPWVIFHLLPYTT